MDFFFVLTTKPCVWEVSAKLIVKQCICVGAPPKRPMEKSETPFPTDVLAEEIHCMDLKTQVALTK